MTSDAQQQPPLTGVLSDSAIAREGVISSNFDDDKCLQGAAYDLRVGHIITADHYVCVQDGPAMDVRGRRSDTVLLQPGQTATLATFETVKLPHDVNGLIVPRDTFAKKGLLTLNAGHVDPGFEGFVTAQVINLTDRPFPLQLKEAYFSIIFSRLDQDADSKHQPANRPSEQRIRELRTTAAQSPVSLVQKETLEKVFVSHDDLTSELVKRVWVFVLALAALGGAGAGIAAAIVKVWF